jgi:hypothetical protein
MKSDEEATPVTPADQVADEPASTWSAPAITIWFVVGQFGGQPPPPPDVVTETVLLGVAVPLAESWTVR